MGRIRFVNVLEASLLTSTQDSTYAALLRMIRQTSTRVLILLGAFIVALLGTIPLFLNWKEYSPIGAVSGYATMVQVMTIILTLLLVTILNYSNSILRSKMKGSSIDKERGLGLNQKASFSFNNPKHSGSKVGSGDDSIHDHTGTTA